MRLIWLISLIMLSGVGIAQDTTMILVTGGHLDERAVSAVNIDGELWFVSNTGSFGSGSSDIYLFTLDSNGSIDKSSLFGGATEDVALDANAFGSGLYVNGVRNNFNNSELTHFLAIFDQEANPTKIIEFDYKYSDYSFLSATFNDTLFILFQNREEFNLVKGVKFYGSQEDSIEVEVCGQCVIKDFLIDSSGYHFLEKRYVDTNSLVQFESFNANLQSVSVSELRGTGNYDPIVLLSDSANYYAVGNFNSSTSQGSDIFFQRVNLTLDTIWERFFIGPEDDYVSSALINQEGFISLLGSTNSYGIGGDFCFGRFRTTNGGYVDFKTLGDVGLDEGVSLVQIDTGGYWLFGTTNGFSSASTDLLIYKSNRLGITESNDFLRIEDEFVYSSLGYSEKPIENSELILYPSPSLRNDKVTLKSKLIITKIEVISASGTKVSEMCEVDDTVAVLDLRELNSPIFFLIVDFENGSRQVVRSICLD
jgi:uncharacterized protein (DUF2164 family)